LDVEYGRLKGCKIEDPIPSLYSFVVIAILLYLTRSESSSVHYIHRQFAILGDNLLPEVVVIISVLAI
jgi:hypothetical protein